MKKASIGICLLLALSLTSCGKIQNSEPANSTGSVQAQPGMDPMALEQNAPKVEEAIDKVNDKLKEEPTFRACMARSIQMCGSEVISRFAQQKDSDESCNIFDDKALKDSCVIAINTELARKSMDTSLCGKLSDFNKDNCEQQVIIAKATKEKDPSICASLKKKEEEKKTASGAAPMMPPMAVDRDSQCALQVIMMLDANEKALEACKSISNESIENNCVSMVKSRMEMQKNMPIPSALPPATVTKTGSERVTNVK